MSQPSETDHSFMRRALRLAMNGRGRVEPNPMVGCVIVSPDGRVIGEGYHRQFGGPHAEPNALASCTESPAGATAYVTLEPCCHTNKKTPPCAPRLIEAKLARVVLGCLDPNPEVDGRGVAMLRAAGVRVDGPVLEAEAKQLIAPFIARTRLGRPYVTLKWAKTADGKVAGPGKAGLFHGKRLMISNARSNALVHQLRARSDAILVGANTIAVDDPTLTARGVETPRPLIRAGLASRSGLFLNTQLSSGVGAGPVTLYCTKATRDSDPKRHEKLARIMHVGIEVVPATNEGLIELGAVLADLHRKGVTHLMVEPGPTLAVNFFATGFVDRLWVFRSPRALNEPGRPAAGVPKGYMEAGRLDLEGDALTEYLNPRSPAFFSNTPSADLVLAGPT